jgi:hypothetical protein
MSLGPQTKTSLGQSRAWTTSSRRENEPNCKRGYSALSLAAVILLATRMPKLPRVPDLEAQRAAMKKFSFLVGEWVGEVRVHRGPGEPMELIQTERVQYKLDGLLLMIEGVGRAKSGGQPALQALGVISFDDENQTYSMRAFNDGRFLETEVKLPEEGKSLTWGFALGEVRTKSVLRIDGSGAWTELHEITIGSLPPRKLMEVTVRRRN